MSGSAFDRQRFETLWGDVARFLVGEKASAAIIHASGAGSRGASGTPIGAKSARSS